MGCNFFQDSGKRSASPSESGIHESAESLGLKGDETFDILDLSDSINPGQVIRVSARSSGGGAAREFKTKLRIDTPVEVEYYRNGGILQTLLRRLAK